MVDTEREKDKDTKDHKQRDGTQRGGGKNTNKRVKCENPEEGEETQNRARKLKEKRTAREKEEHVEIRV